MKLKLILGAALLAASPLLSAQGSDVEASDPAELKQQLEQAQQDLAEAAQRMARLQRKLVQSEGGAQAWVWQGERGSAHGLDLDIDIDPARVRHIVSTGFPPRLGALLGDPDSEDRNLIVGVTPGSGAEQAGLRQDDRLIAVDGQDVTVETDRRIRDLLSDRKPGDSVDVMVQRGDDTELVVPVRLGSVLQDISMLGERMGPMMQDIEQHIIRLGPGSAPPAPPMSPGLTGLGRDTHLINNHPGLKPYFGTSDGVLVLRIAEDNSLNLESGDIVLSVDGDAVNRPVDLGRALLSREAGSQITMQVMRQGALTEVYGTQSRLD